MRGLPHESESFHNPPPTVLFSTGDGSGGKLDEGPRRVKRMTRQFDSDMGPKCERNGQLGWRSARLAATLPTVIEISCTQVEVHVFRRRGKRLEMLLLRRSPLRSLAGVWQPVTGGIERAESAMAAAAREVLEETGLRPLRWWALEQPASFYDVAHDRIRVVPVFAAEVAWADRVRLSEEHDLHAFVSLAEAGRRVLWGTQRQAHRALADEVLSGSSGGAAREVTSHVMALAGPRAAAVHATARRGNTSGIERTASAKPSRPRAAAATSKREVFPRRTTQPKK